MDKKNMRAHQKKERKYKPKTSPFVTVDRNDKELDSIPLYASSRLTDFNKSRTQRTCTRASLVV